ncbi:thrombospondin type-1 domain-containing protein 7B isoform X1 [Nerophis lumbriciformis]|uniref:thrombospondin type-1 domain-containing protein 7B isoform X1 n=1 Tax=Nerophis lumbriciformis TaxID=546530 RepID=UPI002AE08831|nr:thrombospondin type-1 domain-containing protein 7B-like isoform X1 [Nerophis lumbriciformis]
MSWTMTLKDDFGVIAWARRTGNFLSFFVLLSLFSVPVQSDIVFHMDHQFSWKTGQWGHCVGEDCGSGGVQTRTIWCVHREGWTTHHSHCNHMDRPESRRHCFKVCDWHQDLFEWELSAWEGCVLVPFFSNELKLRTPECVTAQHGIQRRKVQCVRTSNRTTVTSRICEFFSQRPPVEQACLIPCPQDCVVSDFDSWSGCSKTCGVGLQHRTRHVLTTSMYGGAGCPNLTDTRTCSGPVACPAGEDEYQYSLKVGAWSQCRLPHHKDALLSGRTTVDFGSNKENNTVMLQKDASRYHQHHHGHRKYPMSWELEVGYQTRQVRCTRSDGKNAMLSLCTKYSSPMTFQACVMPKDCQTSDWSLWNPCSKTCRSADLSPGYRLRSRVMTQMPVGGGKQCPVLEEKEACNIMGDLLPHCPRYEWRTTDWDGCLVSPLLSKLDRRLANVSSLCGGGIQTRKPYCVQVADDSAPNHRKEVSRPVTARLCAGQEPPLAVKNCSIPCQHHCLLSHWSPWGACVHDKCKDPHGKKGFIQRRREVMWASSSPLDVCPHLAESIPCEDPACYRWQVQREGKCMPDNSTCGPGTVARSVQCVSAEGEDVPTSYCGGDPPPTQAPCEVACRADCVLSVWSPWSPCTHSCASKTADGRQSRTRTVLALPGKDGKKCPGPPALEEWRVCNDHPCLVFYWEASAWGPCMADPFLDFNQTSLWNETSACATGVQIRKVTCLKMNGGLIVSKRCPESTRPETLRPCDLPCKKDCIVTPFSEWTACPSTCVPENTSSATQSRYRTIIQRSADGGQECPDTLYEERECESLQVCPIYRWRTHKWHSCTLVPDPVQRSASRTAETCGSGLETRGVSCAGDQDLAANMTECLRWAGPLPAQIRECRVACRDDCALTPWSKFSECGGGCGGFQRRKRSLLGRSKKKEQCLDEALYPLEEKEACPCEEYLSQPFGNWSDCILDEPSTPDSLQGWMSSQEVKECGQGLRYTAVACLDQRGGLVEPTLCTDEGYTVEMCHVPCPLDCKLSDWSAWSACSASCGSGLKVRSKWLREKAFNGGRPCPKLDLKNQVNEAVPCHSECSQYAWRIEPWSICTINTVGNSPSCGEGVQSRKIRCVKKGTSGEVNTVEDSLCDQEEMPPRAQVCFLACHHDCVVSPWGPWSHCPSQCDQGSERNRSRHLLRPPAAEGATCPEMVQSESCILNSTCFTYLYQVSEWSTCRLSENAVCGQGSRQRLLDCVRSDGKIVASQACEQFGLLTGWKLVESCVIDCPFSCVLSDWSPWGQCSHTCGSQGKSVRTRRILQEAHEEGRPCPNQLVQTKTCPIRPCYTWLLSDWSPCTIEGADCGEGLRRRNLSCVTHQGDGAESPPVPVAEEFCGDKLGKTIQQETEQPCFIPCQGDCHLAEWSSWSACQLTCVEGRSFETTGRQSRSRAVIVQVVENQDACPRQVFQTQPCKGGQCHSYQWRTGGWSNNERAVWCQRSDGLIVTGGCFPQKRPSVIQHCHPPCTKPFSRCASSGVCGCEKGYTEVMTTHGFLDYCTRTPGVDTSKKADVKTNSGRSKPSQARDRHTEWTLRPVGPDGRVKLWVYAVTAVGFILILLVIASSFLVCKPAQPTKTSPPPQKPLTLAYDGDIDM